MLKIFELRHKGLARASRLCVLNGEHSRYAEGALELSKGSTHVVFVALLTN